MTDPNLTATTEHCAYQRWITAVAKYERAYAQIPWWRRLLGATPVWPANYGLFAPDCDCTLCNGSEREGES